MNYVPAGRLVALQQKVETAEKALLAELEKQFPEGSEVRCWIAHGQVNASTGTVIGHNVRNLGYVGVRLNSKKQDVRWLTPKDVRIVAADSGVDK